MQNIVIGKNRHSLAKMIGRGGEGAVYKVEGQSGQAVKIYNAALRSSREGKVRAMVGEGLSSKTDLVAFPGEVVTDDRGNFLGFAMRLVAGYRPLHELYSPKSRQRHFPKADYRFIVHTALNVARAVGKVHQTGCVIGDLNHSGVLVAENATVALIDADSFQFQLKGRSYPCVVGVPDFTPPELHGLNLATAERTIEHDNFGLAVALFHLLFMGRHPYAGRYSGPDISMGDAIAQNRFAFSLVRQIATKTSPPPGALTLSLFPDTTASAFEQAFGLNASARPSASDWIGVLTKLERSMNHCSRVKTHYFPSNMNGCGWCAITKSSGFDMFPDLSSVSPSTTTDVRGTEQAIREILAFRLPKVSDLLPQVSAPRKISATLREAKKRKRGRALLASLMIASAVGGAIVAFSLWFIWVGLAIWGWSTFSNSKIATDSFLKAYDEADRLVQRELEDFVRRNGVTEALKVRNDLDAIIATYEGHDETLARELMLLISNREARQRQAYLDGFSIRGASISGIGPSKTSTLISFGIETAADVNQSAVMNVPGFGQVMTGKLLDWRRKHESRFRYNRMRNTQDVADEKALRGRFATEKAMLESKIQNGLGTLRNAKTRLNALPEKARGDRALLAALDSRAQASKDLQNLGAPVSPSKVTLKFSIPPHPAPKTQLMSVQRTSISANSNQGAPNCPFCGKVMVSRRARKGRNAGNQFWGCSGYPYCKGTRSLAGQKSYNP
ncbi:topoisomerase DNA-binding C4 zinc finger domain-containing protein [Roseovarius sp.]|uniref:helix-hairpin-helix domain-containing protein n=1 Tax=Roseovarius sp. TaxID=1486281 RepID=UPI003A970E34